MLSSLDDITPVDVTWVTLSVVDELSSFVDVDDSNSLAAADVVSTSFDVDTEIYDALIVWSNVCKSVSNGVYSNVRNGVSNGVYSNVRKGVSNGVAPNVWTTVFSNVWKRVSIGVSNNVWTTVSSNVWKIVCSSVWDNVSSNVWERVSSGVNSNVWMWVIGETSGVLIIVCSSDW